MPRTTEGWIPKQDRTTLQCKECKQDKPPCDFNTHGTSKSGFKAYNSRCKQCGYKHAATLPSSKRVEKSMQEKLDLVARYKVRCVSCEYSKCTQALDFHHVDDSTKLFEVSDIWTNRAITVEMLHEEIIKCVVLCCRCHRELHAGLEVRF